MKVWVVQGIWHDRRDISSGDANTKIIKIMRHKPTTAEAQEILDAGVHNPDFCKEDKRNAEADGEIYKCHRCWPEPKLTPKSGEGLDDGDEFGENEDHGWILEVVETELEDA